MAIRVALQHRTTYTFDRLVTIGPHEIRLRPAPHCRTPILGYSFAVEPETHFLNWQQDPYGNWVARLVFTERASKLEVKVGLTADLTVINPFDFFVEPYAETYPFAYHPSLAKELIPFLETAPLGPRLGAWLAAFRDTIKPGDNTVTMLVRLNQQLQTEIRYLVRMAPGVQKPEQTLEHACGSCRDTGWLLVQILRQLGIAARFASGYLIQLTADQKPLDGPAGPERDFTDLHAWAEAYLPGAGWVGLDPTSGLLAGEGHIPLACTADPGNAAPVIGYTDVCGVEFDFAMQVTRVHEDPRVTKPYSDAQWAAINALGEEVDVDLATHDVRLTQGGEPTFVSIDDMEGAEWNTTASGTKKRELAEALLERLQARFAPSGFRHYGQGKWYPGEPLPRWALSVFWRSDGEALWRNAALLADTRKPGTQGLSAARALTTRLADTLGLGERMVITAYEDVPRLLKDEAALPVNADPLQSDLADAGERARLARLLLAGLEEPCGYVLPLKAGAEREDSATVTVWESSPWPLRRERLYAVAGDSPLGFRLPLSSLPDVLPEEVEHDPPVDPFAPKDALPRRDDLKRTRTGRVRGAKPREVVKTALTVQVRAGHVHVFMPPLMRLEDYVGLLAALEDTAQATGVAIVVEGYAPPRDARVQSLSVTPDPGVIEVNIHPASSWPDLIATTTALYEEARLARLGTEKFMLDGRHTGTGGGNHITLGGATPGESPLLRRPDLLQSLITYWQNHPALSYLFSGLFIGPTSQAPRVDEARDERLYELEIAFQQLERKHRPDDEAAPWLIDRLLRHLLVDLTGNTHRAEFSIDKLYSPEGPTGRLGLLEFRAFEMPPHARMSAVQMLLLRALVARFWQQPYRGKLVRWGTALHDRWLLPHFVAADMRDVVTDLNAFRYAFDPAWFEPFVEFRFPRFGTVSYDAVTIELRQAIEPWHVLGEQISTAGTARFVDSSVERLQVKVSGMIPGRHAVTCNRRALPLTATGVPGEFVAGVRFRAWNQPSALHPTIEVQAPLTFDLVDTWAGRALGGCTYHVAHPGGRNYKTFPVNANEAEARRIARFWTHGHTPGPMLVRAEAPNPALPTTLDLRWQPVRKRR